MKRETRNDVNGEERAIEEQDPAVNALSKRNVKRAVATALRQNFAMAQTYDNLNAGAMVAICAAIYQREFGRLLDQTDYDGFEIHNRAGKVWKMNLPDLVDRRTTLGYIACIAWGAKMGILTAMETKTMMFTAQTQLTLLKAQDPAPAPAAAPQLEGGLFPVPQQRSMEASKP